MDKTRSESFVDKFDKTTKNDELKRIIHKMIDDVSDRNILIKIFTFIKYLK